MRICRNCGASCEGRYYCAYCGRDETNFITDEQELLIHIYQEVRKLNTAGQHILGAIE